MTSGKGLVLDANIILRAVLGIRVRQLLESYEDVAHFYSADACFAEAEAYLPDLAKRRGLDLELANGVLREIGRVVQAVEESLYASYEQIARERIGRRDPRDWPTLAVALLLKLPVWTEDQDFFGSGIAIWTTDRVELYLRDSE